MKRGESRRPQKRHRFKLGEGYIWFHMPRENSLDYIAVSLKKERHGGGGNVLLQRHGLGAWQKVKLYAEF